ncbi:restriction endonuclease subunit S [filamentous cyanobacterium LEGE 11480]|uniref:Restriction endonuclease subunit S n=1 Tax=Romeriopsis navalis LEGE 11480 TaxID=2777977 RepID=A0A928VRS1_9CYAN|nr:restriction endonuclease subunit S [Romeriopsis navalis]MBE9030974.1 restriction endonuclease subunit S [Romeriopsis navalis LEGE 11480]
MDLQTFWDNFDVIAAAPGGVQRLRELILDLAVRGKLVPQDQMDESAAKLLENISERHTLLDPKQYRKPKNLLPINEIEKPFDSPLGWSWCRFTDVGLLGRGKSKHRPRNDPALYAGGTIPLVQTGDVARADQKVLTHTALYNEAGLAQSRLWPKGTLCITIAANIADSAILAFDACFPDSVVGFIPTSPIESASYFDFFIRTMKSRLEDFAPSTAQKNINLAILNEVLIPLPPLAEQKRIVAKVDELMALCDRYEAAKVNQDTLRTKLRASSIDALMNADTDEALNASWEFVCYNWINLSQTLPGIDNLRKVILQLGVRGKLVPQNVADEPVSSLLEKADEHRNHLEAIGKIRKQKKKIMLHRLTWHVPKHWEATGLSKVAFSYDHLRVPINKTERATRHGNIPYYGANGQVGWIDEALFDEDLVLVVEDETFIGRVKPFSYQISGKAWVNNHAHVLKPSHALEPEFLNCVLMFYPFAPLTSGTTGRRKLNQQTLMGIEIPLPPLAEQKRIVAKVDQLMTLCDTLETHLRETQEKSKALAAAVVGQLEI